jgi:hypothetical protein
MPKQPGIQLLRALAAVMVLIGHVMAEAEYYFAMTLPFSTLPWTRGVDFFLSSADLSSPFQLNEYGISRKQHAGSCGGDSSGLLRSTIYSPR